MTAREIIAEYNALGPQDPEVFLTFIAARWYDARLENGARVLDQTDARQFMLELAAAASFKRQTREALAGMAMQTGAVAGLSLAPLQAIDSDESWQASNALLEKIRHKVPLDHPPLATFAFDRRNTFRTLMWMTLVIGMSMAVGLLVLWKWGGQ